MTLTQRYSNDTMVRNYTRIYDPGHSWLQVPIRDVRGAGVYNKITPYSPIKGGKMYLEEDCDLYTLYKAMTDKGYTVNITEVHVDDFEVYLETV
jgi:hypothetical protein